MSSEIYMALKRELDKGKKAVVVTQWRECKEESFPLKMIVTENMLWHSEHACGLDSAMLSAATSALETGRVQYKNGSGGSFLAEPYFPRPNLILFGGGTIAKPLSEFASGYCGG